MTDNEVLKLIRRTDIEQTRVVRIFLDEGAPEVNAIPPRGHDPRWDEPYRVSPCMVKITWTREKDSDPWKIRNVFAEGWGPDRRVRQAQGMYPDNSPTWILALAGQFQPETDGS